MSYASETSLKVKPEKIPLETDQGIIESEERKWGIPLKDVYKHGLSFYKDKDGKAVHLSYEDRLKLVAFTQQAVHGPLNPNSAPALGVLDVIGRDRRAAWQALGNISQVQAMAGFIHTLDRLCPLFKPYIEAIQKDLENKKIQEQKKKEDDLANTEIQRRIDEEKQKQLTEKKNEEQQIQRIKDALNAQTYDQFLQYAQQQYPGNFDQQAILIRQLQDQHYQQYIQQLAVDQRLANSNIQQELNDKSDVDTAENTDKEMQKDYNLNDEVVDNATPNNKSIQTQDKTDISDSTVNESKEEESDDDCFPPIEEPRMWTSVDVERFKETVLTAGGKLVVSHGETVTVRVPTHQAARSLSWEFATDHYDIGFGLYFEWSKSTTSEVTIQVSETDDEYDADDDGYGDDDYAHNSDPEAGDEHECSALTASKPPISLIVPVYRRDCHIEVYGGNHRFPCEGVYLLKFDNTYSLWRSKTVYYKVYYSY